MTGFDIELAGQTLNVGCRYRLTAAYLDPFRVGEYRKEEENAPAIFASDSDIERFKMINRVTELNRGEQPRAHAEWFFETQALHEQIARELVTRGVLLVHGSAVVTGGRAYLFIAPTRTGKSTHTRLWLELLGSDAYIVNDDKQLLYPTDSGVLTYASPWGVVPKPDPDHAPVAAIVLLSRGSTDVIRPAERSKMLPALMKASLRGKDAAETTAILDLQDKVLSSVKLYELQCTPTPHAAEVAIEALTKDS